MNRRAVLIISILLTYAAIPIAHATIWSEVIRFTGSGLEPPHETTHFFIDYFKWRILWQYVPDPDFPDQSSLNFFADSSSGEWNYTFHREGSIETNGILNFSGTGECYLVIMTGCLESYTIIVEQDLDSIPEFPSFLMPLILMIATLPAIIVFRRRQSQLI